jgi:hypothetical protein
MFLQLVGGALDTPMFHVQEWFANPAQQFASPVGNPPFLHQFHGLGVAGVLVSSQWTITSGHRAFGIRSYKLFEKPTLGSNLTCGSKSIPVQHPDEIFPDSFYRMGSCGAGWTISGTTRRLIEAGAPSCFLLTYGFLSQPDPDGSGRKAGMSSVR